MDLVVEMRKNAKPERRRLFSHDFNNRKGWVIDNWKNARLQSGACFTIYQQPDDDKILIYEMK